MDQNTIFLVILGMSVTTGATRMLPLLLLTLKPLPAWLMTWLRYVPVAILSAMLLLWKIIHMGEIFGRNASLYPAREAFADLLTLDALAAFGGTVGLMVVLATVLPFLLPSSSKAKQI